MSDEARARKRIREACDAIVDGVEARLPAWAVTEVARILDAWGKADSPTRARAEADSMAAGRQATDRVVRRLRELLALDPSDQAVTPLEVVRSAYVEPTAVLAAAGIPPVVRDAFDERAWPDDRYGLALSTFAALPDPDGIDDLGPLHLSWGLAKAALLRGPGAPEAPPQ